MLAPWRATRSHKGSAKIQAIAWSLVRKARCWLQGFTPSGYRAIVPIFWRRTDFLLQAQARVGLVDDF